MPPETPGAAARFAGVVLLAAVLAGCGLLEQGRTFRAGDVTVIDETNLVVEVTDGAPAPDEPVGDEPLVASPETLRAISVYWTGNSCVDEWIVRLRGYGLELTIEPGRVLEGCDGTFTQRAVTLRLDRVISAESVDVTLAEEP